MHIIAHIEVRGQLLEVSSTCLPCGFEGLNSDHPSCKWFSLMHYLAGPDLLPKEFLEKFFLVPMIAFMRINRVYLTEA